MSFQIERRAIPSLMGGQRREMRPGYGYSSTLLDLLHDGFYLLFMLKQGSAPPGEQELLDSVRDYLAGFEREARKLHAASEDIEDAKYAWCSALDEIILASGLPLRAAWERNPLQLAVFGDQLAGEHFYDRLETLRSRGSARVQALQVFHMCLLLGFRGKYATDGSDKLAWLTSRLGDEIAHIRGRGRGFAPHVERPDQVAHKLRSNTPLWVMATLFALVAVSTYAGLRASLRQAAQDGMAAYSDVVKLAPRPAYVTITLP